MIGVPAAAGGEPREVVHRQPAGQPHPVVARGIGEARADHEVRARRVHRLQQAGDLARIVLPVGVALHDDGVPLGHGVPEAAAERATDAEVHGESEHGRAGARRDLRGLVERAVVDHERGVAVGAHLVARRDLRSRSSFHAGITTSTS